MGKQWMGLVVVAALGVAVGCGEDEPVSGGGAGSGGTAGSGGSGGSGGSAGSTGGTSGNGGAGGGTGGSAGVGPDAGPAASIALVSGTDFFSKTEVAAVNLVTNSVATSTVFNDGDAVPLTSGSRAFVLERTNDVVHLLDATGAVLHSIPVETADGGAPGPANPAGIAAVSDKAFVTLYGRNRVAELSLTSGSVTGDVDLASLHESSDADGAVDVGTPVYDGATNRVLVTLQRIDRTTIAPPDFQVACPSVPSLVVGFDAFSLALETPIPLTLKNPVEVVLDVAQNRLLVLAAGCFTAGQRTGHGVEAVDLGTSQTSVLYTPTDGRFLSRMIVVGPNAMLINSFDETFAEHWNHWTTTSSTLGAEISGVPQAPSFESAGNLVGLVFAQSDAGASAEVVRYNIASETQTGVIATNPFTESFSASGGTAIIK